MKLHHPLWTHTPAVLLVAFIGSAFWRAWPLPDPTPVHFGAKELPDRFGASWEMLVAFFGVALVMLGISVAIDEAWARQERERKRFNWFATFDEIGIAFLTALTLDYLATVAEPPFLLQLSWGRTFALVAGALALAVMVERRRPFRPLKQVALDAIARGDVEGLELGERWAYWEAQNPRYTKWYIPLFGVGLVALGIKSWGDNAWAPPLALVSGVVVLLLLTGGFRVEVKPTGVVLRAGLLGLPLLRLGKSDVAEAVVQTFSPLADFGGYGIRRNKEMLAFVLEGTTGVRVTTTEGKKYLIGSSQPERLATVIRAAFRAG
jgi:hypothetical protein